MRLSICDWACDNRAYLHKLHIFRKCYFSWTVLMIFMFCKLSLLSYWFKNMALRFQCHNFCTSKDIVNWSSKIRPNFVCRYALFSQAWSHMYYDRNHCLVLTDVRKCMIHTWELAGLVMSILTHQVGLYSLVQFTHSSILN